MFYFNTINYSISKNWEIMLIGQSAVGEKTGQISSVGNVVFLRLMLSY